MGMAAATVGASVVGGLVQGRNSRNASRSAARAQQQASQAAMAQQDARFAQTREDLAPWQQQGMNAFQMQGDLSGANGFGAQNEAFDNFQASPGQEFLRTQGMRGLENNMASQGRGGGARMEALTRFNQGLAAQDFGNQFNRLQGIAGMGASAAGQQAQAGMAQGAAQGQNLMSQGAAQAGGILGAANANNQMIGNVAGAIGAFAGSRGPQGGQQ